MFKRVMVAVVGIPFLLLVLLWAPDWATMLLVAAMCAIGAWELLHAVGDRGSAVLMPVTVAAAALVPLDFYLSSRTAFSLSLTQADSILDVYGAMSGSAYGGSFLVPLALLFVFVLFVLAIARHGREDAPKFGDVTAALFAGLVFPMMLSTLLLLRLVPGLGKVLVFVPLCISFGSDTFALFAGMAFGKHKLAPLVSPKKTVEGGIGGLVGGILGMLLIRWIGILTLDTAICSVLQAILFGLVGSIISQIGDLSFSVIKREFGVKDYGKLLPGHGGILDRFDSVTFVSPFVYLALTMMVF